MSSDTRVVFVVPYALDTSLRFARAVAALPGVRTAVVTQEAPERLPADFRERLVAVERVDDALDSAQLEAALRQPGHDVRLVNAGVSGDTSAGGKARLEWSLAEAPDAAIVEFGANDGLRGLSPEAMRANLDAILTTLEARGIPTLLAGMRAPPNLGREYADAFRKVYADLAAEHPVVFYPFFLDGVAADPALNQDDGIHPNAEGVAAIVERILPKVEDLLSRVKRRQANRG